MLSPPVSPSLGHIAVPPPGHAVTHHPRPCCPLMSPTVLLSLTLRCLLVCRFPTVPMSTPPCPPCAPIPMPLPSPTPHVLTVPAMSSIPSHTMPVPMSPCVLTIPIPHPVPECPYIPPLVPPTSLVFQRSCSLGRTGHLGRHSTSFRGRKTFRWLLSAREESVSPPCPPPPHVSPPIPRPPPPLTRDLGGFLAAHLGGAVQGPQSSPRGAEEGLAPRGGCHWVSPPALCCVPPQVGDGVGGRSHRCEDTVGMSLMAPHRCPMAQAWLLLGHCPHPQHPASQHPTSVHHTPKIPAPLPPTSLPHTLWHPTSLPRGPPHPYPTAPHIPSHAPILWQPKDPCPTAPHTLWYPISQLHGTSHP